MSYLDKANQAPSMRLPDYVADWPADWLYAYQERLAIMADSGVLEAQVKAEADTRHQAARYGQIELGGTE